MPKEIIKSKYYDDFENEPEVRVGWSKEAEHVELAVINPDEDAVLTPTPEGNGWFAQLNRYQINELIRALRKARDQAYGRDE